MNAAATSLWGGLLDLLYPRVCGCCGAPAESAPGHLCWDCRAALEIVTEDYCSRCGDPVDGVAGHAYLCSACVDHAPAFDLARSAVRYRGGVQAALQDFKYRGAVQLKGDFVMLLKECVRWHYPRVAFDAVACVPLYPQRERERGYNQAGLLASGLARALKLPYLANALRRVRATGTQTHLSAAQRRANVKGAFAAAMERWIDGRTFLLVDDVMTTGATVDQCARMMKSSGAAAVYIATVARG